MKARRVVTLMLALACLTTLAACNTENNSKRISMKKQVVLDVVVFNYTNRPIFEVLLNHRVDGGAAAFDGGRAISVGVPIPLGPQTLTWRLDGSKGTPRNGETVISKVPLTLAPEQIPPDSRYLAVHIYPDDTAELTVAQYLPDPTERGRAILEEAERNER